MGQLPKCCIHCFYECAHYVLLQSRSAFTHCSVEKNLLYGIFCTSGKPVLRRLGFD